MAGIKKGDKGLESLGFLAEVAGRAQAGGESGRGDRADCPGRKQSRRAKIDDGAFDILPGSVLREDGADDDLEAGAAGPPVLGTVSGEERLEVGDEGRTGSSTLSRRSWQYSFSTDRARGFALACVIWRVE